MIYKDGWRNRLRALYSQYCYRDEVFSTKLLWLIDTYGSAFDDEWYYIPSKDGKVIIRSPVWLGKEPSAHKFHEKVPSHHEDIFQTKLTEKHPAKRRVSI